MTSSPSLIAHLPRSPLPINVDSTMISAFRQCPQKFFLEFCHGYRPRAISIDLHAGAAFAEAMEATYKAVHMRKLPMSDALAYGHAAFSIYWGDFEIPDWKRTAKTFDRTWEAVEDYFRTYPPLTDHVQPFFKENGEPTFEYTFAIPLDPCVNPEGMDATARNLAMLSGLFPTHPSGDPWIYSGRFDMLGRYLSRPCVRDEKTTGSSIGSAWADQWSLRSQFMGYVWACQQAGMDLDTVCVRGIAIQKTQIVHAEAIKTYDRFKVAMWLNQLRRDLWRIRNAYDENYFDYNFADACSSYGGCVFKDTCSTPHKLSHLADFEVRHWNPLNKNPIKDAAETAQ